MQVIDVGDPDNPQALDSFSRSPTPQSMAGLQVADGLIYVTGYLVGLQILSREPEMLTTSAIITASGGQTASGGGAVQLDFPAGAVQDPLTVLFVGQLRSVGALDNIHMPARRFKLEGLTPNGQTVEQTSLPYTMVISYTDTQLEQLGVQEDKLTLLRWDGETWVDLLPCEGCGVDTEQNRVTVVLDRFGEFALTEQEQYNHRVFVPLVGS